ncbi:MAG: TRAP transporter small permease [Coprococcus sp.]
MEKAKIIGLKNLKKMLLQWALLSCSSWKQSMLSANSLLRAGWAFRKKSQSLPHIWVCFFCASYCTKRGANIIVDALTAKYPKKLQNFLFSAQFVFDGILTVFFIYGSVIFVAQTKAEGSVGVTGMPLWLIYLAPLVGFALNLIRDIQMFIKTIKSSDEVSVS